MNNCTINSKITLSDSIIANGSKIESSDDLNKQFLLGERSHLKLQNFTYARYYFINSIDI